MTLLTYEVCPRNSFKVFPDFNPWALIVVSKEELTSWELSLLNIKQVMPLEWAFSNFLKHCPVEIFQTLIWPCSDPDANISESLKNRTSMTICEFIQFSWNRIMRNFYMLMYFDGKIDTAVWKKTKKNYFVKTWCSAKFDINTESQ